MYRRRLLRALVAAGVLLLVASCARMLAGTPTSVFDDPFRVGGLQAVNGITGLRPDAPKPTGTVKDTDDGEVDSIASQSVSDIEVFWKSTYPNSFKGSFQPVDKLISWNAKDRGGHFCDESTFELVNAGFCGLDNTIGWDRGVLLPVLRHNFGDMSITMVLAHEYGHAIQQMAKLTNRRTPILVAEQQSDCLAGVYLRWVAEGHSSRFTLSTGDGLNNLLASMLAFRDPLLHEDETLGGAGEHGSAFERISAFQFGFTDGAHSCTAIDAKEITARRGGLPVQLGRDQTGEEPVSKQSVRAIVDAMNILFRPVDPPKLSFDAKTAAVCSDARPSPPASYCPDANSIVVDLPELTKMGTRSEDNFLGGSGDDTAYSVVMSRYMLAMQREYGGLTLNSAKAALRTACLTGVSTAMLFNQVSVPGGNTIVLTAGDIDEAVSGLLTNGLVASDVNGDSVPSGFSRIDAFRTGVLGDTARCIKRYP